MFDLRLRNSWVFWQLCYDSQHLFISSRNESLINLLTEVLFMMGSTTLQFINPLFYQDFMIVIWERLWFFFLLALATTVLAGCYTTRNSVHHKITIWPHNLDTPALNLKEGNQNIAEYTGDVLLTDRNLYESLSEEDFKSDSYILSESCLRWQPYFLWKYEYCIVFLNFQFFSCTKFKKMRNWAHYNCYIWHLLNNMSSFLIYNEEA